MAKCGASPEWLPQLHLFSKWRSSVGVKHMTSAERDECIQLYLREWTLDALADRYYRSRNTIINLVKRRGVQRGKPKWMTGLSRTTLWRKRQFRDRTTSTAERTGATA